MNVGTLHIGSNVHLGQEAELRVLQEHLVQPRSADLGHPSMQNRDFHGGVGKVYLRGKKLAEFGVAVFAVPVAAVYEWGFPSPLGQWLKLLPGTLGY